MLRHCGADAIPWFNILSRTINLHPEIETIVLMEANRIAARAEHLTKPAVNPLDSRLRKLRDVDARIVLTWDTDATDIDLWVTEPTGETYMYDHNRTWPKPWGLTLARRRGKN